MPAAPTGVDGVIGIGGLLTLLVAVGLGDGSFLITGGSICFSIDLSRLENLDDVGVVIGVLLLGEYLL